MGVRWRRICRGLLLIGSVVLLVSAGVASAHGGDGTETPVTTTHHDTQRTSDGHEATEVTEAATDHHDGTNAHQSGGGHAHGGENAEATASDHHRSGQQSNTGHSHDEGGLLGGWLSIVGGLFLLGAIATAPTYRYLRSTASVTVTPVHLAGALLALFTAAVHLYLFFAHGEVVMLLAGLGFVGGVVLLFAGVARQYLYATGIVYTFAQIVLWINAGTPHLSSFGLLDKVAQVSLIVVLGYLYARTQSDVRL